ncbi:MAG TPA: RseA family anti-sigma factor [Burkholderiaceae bacterium]|nr:RseA family anti-sigma factor [Burkholderiaceae bacterium]
MKAPVAAARCDAETLSSLMDGELDPEQAAALIAALCADDELRAEWIAFHLAGDALRSTEVASAHSSSFCMSVAAAIAREPAIVAPRPWMRHGARLRRYILPGLAVAASAAVISFVAVPLLRNANTPALVQAAAVQPPSAAVVTTEHPDELAARRAAATVANARALQAYLAAHRELTTGAAFPRATPYLRTATDQSESR